MDATEADQLRPACYTDRQRELLDAIKESGGIAQASRIVGMAERNAYKMLERIRKSAADQGVTQTTPEFTASPIPDGELSYDELKAMRHRVFQRKAAHQAAKRWRKIHFREPEPTGIVVMGDPHVDDDGCNWPQLDADTQTIINTPGMFAGSIGDNTNNWVGRLQRLYANQSTTESQAWRLCEGWLRELTDPGKLIFLVRGNHDMWSGASDPHNWILRGSGAIDQDWQAQMEFCWPGCEPFRVWVAHDFKGHSIYNPLHSHKRKHLWHGAQADAYIAGHRHHWALSEEEDEAGNVVTFARARGYKFVDSYADVLGHGSQQYGASIVFVVQPQREGVNRIRPFPCVQEAADYLTFLRARRAA
jgi:hypothetical protein